MTITTYTAFVAALMDLTVTDVIRYFDEPPASIGSADLPAMFPMLPRGSEAPFTFVSQGGWPSVFVDIVIAVEAVGQGTQPQNYAAMLDIMDHLSTALRAASIGRAKLNWTINANVNIAVGETNYWAV